MQANKSVSLAKCSSSRRVSRPSLRSPNTGSSWPIRPISSWSATAMWLVGPSGEPCQGRTPRLPWSVGQCLCLGRRLRRQERRNRFFRPSRADLPKTRYLDFVYQPIKDEGGNVTSIFVEGVDITDRHASERSLRQSEARLRELNADLERQVVQRAQARSLTWKLSPDLLGALNAKGYFETANPAWESVLGWTEAEVVSMSIFELLHYDDLEHTRAGFRVDAGGAGGTPFRQSLSLQGRQLSLDFLGRHSGRRLCLLHRRDANGRGARRKSNWRQRKRPAAIPENGSDWSSHRRHRSWFSNNLLTGIIGSLDIDRRRIAADRLDEIPRFMDAATGAAERAGTLTHRLLAFARRQSLDIRPNDITRLIANLEDLLHRTLGEQITLKCAAARASGRPSPMPTSSEVLVESRDQCARDAMAEGGRLTIAATNVHLDAAYIAQHADVEVGDYVEISVADTGSGMPADVVARPRSVLHHEAGRQGGRASGSRWSMASPSRATAICASIARVGHGTTIRAIPAPRTQQDAVILEQRAETSPRGHGETILVVEDDATVRLVLAEPPRKNWATMCCWPRTPDQRSPFLQSDRRIDLMVSDVMFAAHQLAGSWQKSPAPHGLISRCFLSPDTPRTPRSAPISRTRHGHADETFRPRRKCFYYQPLVFT